MEVVVTTGNISRTKLQSNHHQQGSIAWYVTVALHWYCANVLQDGCPSCRPTNNVKGL